MADWKSFWDSPHSIYVNARHKDVHYREIAEQIVRFVPEPGARVLDFGCGEAVHAKLVAEAAGELLLTDSAPSVRADLAARYSSNSRIRVLAPEDLVRLPDACLDLIVANSVVQYLRADEFDSLLALWRRLLAPRGSMIIADVIPPQVGAISDVAALLRYAYQHGFLLAALIGLTRTAVSPYRKLRKQLGITQYTEQEFLKKLLETELVGERLAKNMEQNAGRMTFRVRHRGRGSSDQPERL